MKNLNDIVLQIHMTFLSNKGSVEWIASFEDDISPLKEKEFQNLINILEGVAQQEQANFMESAHYNNIPAHIQTKESDPSNFYALIEQLMLEYTQWKR